MNKYSANCNPSRPRNTSMAATLQNAGIDTDGYLSLRIHPSMLPAESELIVQIRDRKSGELFTLNLNDDDNRLLGRNSRFYGQIMADGHVFNPYIHRRFIAVQFRELVKRHGIDGVRDAVARQYDWKYAIEQVKKECHKLANLARHDRAGFEERSMFFSLSAIVSILSDYVQEVHRTIDASVSRAGHGSAEVYVCNYGRIDRNNIRPMKYRFTRLLTEAAACITYAQLDKLLEKFDFLELDRRLRLPDSFVTPFINAGAYYTLKNAIMFEGKTLYRCDCAGSLKALSDAAKRTPNGAMNLYYSQG